MKVVVPVVGVVVLLSLAGCAGGGGARLVVDVKTDLRPGVDFVAVRTEVASDAPDGIRRADTTSALAGEDFVTGVRVTELEALPRGEYSIRATLVDAAARAVVARATRVRLRGDLGVVVLITRDCVDVECPMPGGDPSRTECQSGRCVSPDCREGCESECSFDVECAVEVDCAEPRCVEGACLAEARDERCGAGQMCDAERGCVARELMDAGPPPPDCVVDTDCGEPVPGAWGPCEGFDHACDDTGQESRDVLRPTCAAGTCGSVNEVETRGCTRDTSSVVCRPPDLTDWGPCEYDHGCDPDGIQRRTRTRYRCDAGECVVSATDEETQGCGRPVEGEPCETRTLCGAEAACRVCRAGICVVNDPDYDDACNPSCGRASLLCGGAPRCCPRAASCPLGTVGPEPSADCGRCCLERCN